MNAPDAEALLQTWDANQGAHLICRALALLDAAWPEVGVEAWSRASIGERDACLLELRETLFGVQLETVADCPGCGERLESSFTTLGIRVQPAVVPPRQASFHLSEQGCDIEYRLPSSGDLLAAVESTSDIAGASEELLRRCVIDARLDGASLDLAKLPSTVMTRLADDMRQRDPGAEVRMALSCPICGHAWSATFDIVSYLWSEIEDWAQRLLADVCVLATACGWSERDILGLSPTRRQIYLDMVQA
jgi:hypothetical protein